MITAELYRYKYKVDHVLVIKKNNNGLSFDQFLFYCKAKISFPELKIAWRNNENPHNWIVKADKLFEKHLERTSISK